MSLSIEPVQLVKEAQQELFNANGLTAPLTLKENKQDLDAALAWLERHAPAMGDYVKSLRNPDGTVSDTPIDWIDTSWTR